MLSAPVIPGSTTRRSPLCIDIITHLNYSRQHTFKGISTRPIAFMDIRGTLLSAKDDQTPDIREENSIKFM